MLLHLFIIFSLQIRNFYLFPKALNILLHVFRIDVKLKLITRLSKLLRSIEH